jgi:DNA mismatch repair ATPase MutS
MKVEIFQHHKNDLHDELDYDLFLSLFVQDQPLLSSIILRCLDKGEAVSHYEQLAKLEQNFQPEKIDTICAKSAALPALDHLLNSFAKGELEQYHLFELGNFLQNDRILSLLEKTFPLDAGARQDLGQILQILEKYTEKSFSTMRINREIEEIQIALAESEESLDKAVHRYEKQITECTTLKMLYPWPRELALSEEQVMNMDSCKLLTLKKNDDVWLIDYNISPELKKLQNRKEKLKGRYESLMQKQLKQLNNELSPYGSCLQKYYRKRVKRTYHYVLLTVKEQNGFCLPEFTSTRGCRLEHAYLYGLKARKKEKCVSLDLSLEKGSTILYGPNMSGKTTVLKTIYFHLTLVQLGLPLPARKVTLHYPKQVALSLKSPGDVRTSSSTYSEELTFYTQTMEEGAYVLSDELFLSTDPVNGVILSGIMIRSMAASDRIFFCTTHYPEILDIKNIALYRMEDADPLLLKKDGHDLQSLHNFMPYRLKQITGSDYQKIRTDIAPLKTALLFDLPEDIKEAIKKHIDKKNI